MDWDFAFFILALCPLLLSIGYFEYRKNKMLHLERMAAIEKGISPASLPGPYEKVPLTAGAYLRRGLQWMIPGLGVVAFLWLTGGEFSAAWTGAAILMSCIGLGYLLYYFLEARRRA